MFAVQGPVLLSTMSSAGLSFPLCSFTEPLGLPIIEPSAAVFDLVNGRRVLLGSGGSSVVYKGAYKDEPVAIKVFRNMRPENINDFVMEVTLHVDSSLRSPAGVCKCYGGWDKIDADSDIFPSMVLEYLPHSLSSVAHNAEKFPITMDSVKTTFLEIAKTFATLSIGTFKFYHNDLNPSNIILTADLMPKLIDFALARRNDGPQSAVAEGTVAYMVGLHGSIVADNSGTRGV
jgi:serine/threonine protein kinase